jgi:cell division protein FtsN
MPSTDRRHALRKKPDQLAYISIEPDNGAIVLNVSGEGLSFHSMAPVEKNGTLRLTLQEKNRRIDVSGEVVWTDEVQKIGGVQFTRLTAEARNQILNWTANSNATAEASHGFGSTLLKALPGNHSRRFARSLTPALIWWRSGRSLRLSGFTRGLAAGLLLSLVAFSVALFSYGHRREFGESLIRLGQRLTANGGAEVTPRVSARPSSATVSSPPTAPPITPFEAKPASVKTRVDYSASHIDAKALDPAPVLPRFQHPEALPARLNFGRDKPHEANFSGVKRPEQNPPSLAAAMPMNLGISPIPIAEQPVSIAKTDQPDASAHVKPAATLNLGVSPLRSGSKVQMFFDLGRFKKEEQAQDLSNKVAQIGIHATVVPKRRLWITSYQVLVGPYDNQSAETEINNDLLAHGYQPRPFERGTRDFAFRSRLTIDRSQLPSGEFTIAWESYIADAKVRFTQGNDLIAAVDGTWVKRPAKFSNNEYVYQVQANGIQPLLEVHFAGMDRALVFRKLP